MTAGRVDQASVPGALRSLLGRVRILEAVLDFDETPAAIWQKTTGLPITVNTGGSIGITFDDWAPNTTGADYFGLASSLPQFKEGLYQCFGVVEFAAEVDWSTFTDYISLAFQPSIAVPVGRGAYISTKPLGTSTLLIETFEPVNLPVAQSVVLTFSVSTGATPFPSGIALARMAAFRMSDAIPITLV